MTGYQRWQQQFPQCGQLKLICNSQQKNLQPWKNPMILLLGSGPFRHTAFSYFLVVMNIQHKNGYNNNNNMSTTTCQQQHVNNNTNNNNNNNNHNNNHNSGDRSNSRSHNPFFVSFDTAGLECNDRMRRTDAMMGCHRRYVSVLKALLTTDAEDITCGQKRHARNSGSTYLSERMPEQMLQVGQTFGTDATSSKTLLADDTALRRIVIRTSKRSEETHKKFRLDLPIWAHAWTDATSWANFWNRCYKFEDTPCRRHCLA